jgi:hypothetical protein
MDTVGVSRHAIGWCRGSTGAGIIVRRRTRFL